MDTTTTRDRLLTSEDVAHRLAISTRTLWQLVAADKAPQPIRYTRKLVRWTQSEIDAYLDRLARALDVD